MSEDQNNTYRPKSPDLSGFAVPPPLPRLSRVPSYRQTDNSFPPGYNFGHRGSYDASPYFSPSTSQTPSSYFVNQPHAPSQTYSPQPPLSAVLPSASPFGSQPHPYYTNQTDSAQQRAWLPPPSDPTTDWGRQNSLYQQAPNLSYPDPYDMARTRRQKVVDYRDDHHDLDYNPNGLSTSTAPPVQQHSVQPPLLTQTVSTKDMIHSIDVKTKFPVARIKRIMQADEDVGKVAQATPTAVSKALELFMITLVSKGANEAKLQNSKRVTAQHLKAALMKDGQFDFLSETCENVAEEGAKKGRAKSEAKSEDSSEEGADAAPKKSKAAKKRKAADDDDD